jgi:hypothetical protein
MKPRHANGLLGLVQRTQRDLLVADVAPALRLREYQGSGTDEDCDPAAEETEGAPTSVEVEDQRSDYNHAQASRDGGPSRQHRVNSISGDVAFDFDLGLSGALRRFKLDIAKFVQQTLV